MLRVVKTTMTNSTTISRSEDTFGAGTLQPTRRLDMQADYTIGDVRRELAYTRVWRLTGKVVKPLEEDWVELVDFLCDWIVAQKKEIGRLQEQVEDKA